MKKPSVLKVRKILMGWMAPAPGIRVPYKVVVIEHHE